MLDINEAYAAAVVFAANEGGKPVSEFNFDRGGWD